MTAVRSDSFRPIAMSLALLASVVILTLTACGGEADQESPTASTATGTQDGASRRRVVVGTEGASRFRLGEVLEDFSLRDLDGKSRTLGALTARGPVALVVRDRDCPVTRKYGPTTAELERRFAARGVTFVFLNLTRADTAAEAREDRDRYGFQGAYVHQPEGTLGRVLGVTSTSEVFVVDGERRLRYRGAIDDRFGVGVTREVARRRFLADALEAVIAGTAVEEPATTAPGCFLDFGESATADAASDSATGPTFHADIEPILQKYCQTCHREGEIAPFHLTDFDDVASRKRMIRHVVEEGSMPPWYADDGVGGPWVNDLRIPAAEKKTLLDWIAAGCPKGDPAAAPKPLPVFEGWKIGDPDLVLESVEPVEVPPEGFYDYVYRVVDPQAKEDRFVERLELRADHLDAIHHILMFEYQDEMSGWNGIQRGYLALKGFYGIWVPGTEPILYTRDRGKLMKAGTRFLLQIHYTGNGEKVVDRPKVGFVFSDEKPRTLLRCDAASTTEINIPPKCPQLDVRAEYVFPSAGILYGVLVHMHLRAVGARIDLIFPDGTSRPVVQMSEYDFNWQQCYRLAEPISFPKGTRFQLYGRYDNSEANPANPDPDSWVSFGLATNDEMLIGYCEWAPTD